MENLKSKIQSYLENECNPNLDSFDSNDLSQIADYMNELNKSGYNHKISKLSIDNQKMEIEAKIGIALFRKKK